MKMNHFHTSDQRVQPVHISHIALVLECYLVTPFLKNYQIPLMQQMAFGISSAPAIFQRVMDSILQGIPRILCYQELIIVGRESV